MRLFKANIDAYFKELKENIKRHIHEINEDELIDSNPIELTTVIVGTSTLPKINIDLSKRTSKAKMVLIKKEKLPLDYDVEDGQSHPYVCVDYAYELSKNSECQMLAYEPKHFRPISCIEASINNDKLIIHHQTFFVKSEGNEQKIIKEISLVQDDIKKSIDNLNEDIQKFNDELKDIVTIMIMSRRDDIIRKRNQDKDLNDF